MNTTVKKALEIAKAQRLSRDVISFAYTKEGKYKAFIRVHGFTRAADVATDDDRRSETSFFYISGKGVSEEEAILTLMAMATYAFNGEDFPTTIGSKVVEKNGVVDTPEVVETTPEVVETTAEVVEEKKVVKKKVVKKKAVVKAPKTIPYSRDNEEHKKQLGVLLNSAEPSWGEDEEKLSIAVGLSKGLSGQPFLDTKGEILAEVIEAITDAFTVKATGTSAL